MPWAAPSPSAAEDPGSSSASITRSARRCSVTRRKRSANRAARCWARSRIRSGRPISAPTCCRRRPPAPTLIALGDTGADAINAIKQIAEFNILGGNKKLAALFMQIVDIDALGLKASQGLLLSEAYYWDLNDSTRAWSKRFAERMEGRMPTINHAATYSATIAYLRAVQAAQTIEGDKVVAQM